MSYRPYMFVTDDDGTVVMMVPSGNTDNGVGDMDSPRADNLAGGYIRLLGATRAQPKGRSFSFKAIIVQSAFGGGPTIQEQMDELAGVAGRPGRFYVEMDDGSLRWKRSEIMGEPSSRDSGFGRQDVSIDFSLDSPHWYSDHYGGDDGEAPEIGDELFIGPDFIIGGGVSLNTHPLAGSSSTVVTLPNSGNAPAYLTRILIQAGSADIANGSSVSIDIVGPGGVHLKWVGTLLAGNIVVIDWGRQKVLNNGANAYSGLDRSAHTAPLGWLVVPPGGGDFTITIVGGGSNSKLIAVYDGANI